MPNIAMGNLGLSMRGTTAAGPNGNQVLEARNSLKLSESLQDLGSKLLSPPLRSDVEKGGFDQGSGSRLEILESAIS